MDGTSRLASARPPILIGLLVLLVAPASRAENWPAWRGPDGTGVSADRALPLAWSDKENVRWHVPLPDRGNSTPVVWGDRVFLTQATEKDHRRTVMCFARADGKPLWQAGVAYAEHEPTNGQNPYCAASPVTDGQRVIACFGSAGVYCYDAASGKEIWHRDLGKVDSWHGSGSSPVIVGELCILNFGPGSNAAVVALDKQTGEPAWKVTPPKVFSAAGTFAGLAGRMMGAPRAGAPGAAAGKANFEGAGMAGDMAGAGGFMGSWSTPVLLRNGDRDELVVVHAGQVNGYDPKTGKEMWSCKGLPEQVFASPAVGDGMLVATGHGMNGGTTAIAIRLQDAKGDVTATHRLWQVRLPKDCVGSPVVFDKYVYLVTNFGSLVCLELATGKKVQEKRLAGEGALSGSWSSIVLADGKLLAANQSGTVFVIKASPDLETLATNSAAEQTTCASPAISDGQLFLRTYDALWCFGKAGK
jgi:outer membrane protein assembly factor BamB